MDKIGLEGKRWMCRGREGRHVLGVVRRNGQRSVELWLFREAVDMDAAAPCDVDVMARVVGHVVDVRCSVCGKPRTWVPGELQMEELVEGVLGMGKS